MIKFSIKIKEVNSPHPIAFVAGYCTGYLGAVLEKLPEGELESTEYTKGYELGQAVRQGNQPRPRWHK